MRQDLRAQIGTHRARLLHYARQQLGNPAHAEDAVQDAMVAALECAHRYAGEAALSTWLTGILRHKIVDCVRRTARQRLEPLEPDTLPGEAPDPQDAAHGADLLRRLDRHLTGMPKKAAQAFMLRDVLGMSAAEASAALEVSAGNCAVLLHRARRRLRARLAGDGVGIPA